jgi:hypothetical protein
VSNVHDLLEALHLVDVSDVDVIEEPKPTPLRSSVRSGVARSRLRATSGREDVVGSV